MKLIAGHVCVYDGPHSVFQRLHRDSSLRAYVIRHLACISDEHRAVAQASRYRRIVWTHLHRYETRLFRIEIHPSTLFFSFSNGCFHSIQLVAPFIRDS